MIAPRVSQIIPQPPQMGQSLVAMTHFNPINPSFIIFFPAATCRAYATLQDSDGSDARSSPSSRRLANLQDARLHARAGFLERAVGHVEPLVFVLDEQMVKVDG